MITGLSQSFRKKNRRRRYISENPESGSRACRQID